MVEEKVSVLANFAASSTVFNATVEVADHPVTVGELEAVLIRVTLDSNAEVEALIEVVARAILAVNNATVGVSENMVVLLAGICTDVESVVEAMILSTVVSAEFEDAVVVLTIVATMVLIVEVSIAK